MDDELEITLHGSDPIVRLENPAPEDITWRILKEAGIIIENLPEKLNSSVIEDLMCQKIQDAIKDGINIDAESIAQHILINHLDEIKKVIDQSAQIAENGEEYLTDQQIIAYKEDIIKEMIRLGADETKISSVKDRPVVLSNSSGTSNSTDNGVSIAQLSVIRKGMDYCQAFNEPDLHKVINAILKNTLGHELGHKISRNSLDEQFAEYWGRIVSSQNPDEGSIIQKMAALQVAETKRTWDVFQKYNNLHETKITPSAIFELLQDATRDDSSQIYHFILSRNAFYSDTNYPEIYASPLNADEAAAIIKEERK